MVLCCSSGVGMPGSALVHRLRSLAFDFYLFFSTFLSYRNFPTYLDVHFRLNYLQTKYYTKKVISQTKVMSKIQRGKSDIAT